MVKSQQGNVIPVAIENEMQESYLDYAMSVIVSRALHDCRDGLKPVHRRILYAMHDTGNHYNKPYRKSARVVGEVMGKYHPHGDLPIYGAMVRLAQDFSLRAPLVDGQGNFGSIDGDSPAHMRYTEARLEKIADLGLLLDIDKETVDFCDNYDGSEREPVVLPARFPNLLVNGANGIAVGMATNIPTHNIGEVVDACCAYLENENVTVEELMRYVPAPDFPGGGEILGYKQSRIALMTGRGGIMVRGKAVFENLPNNHKAIVISSIPYQVNKAELVKSIEVLSTNKTIEGIIEVSDETNKLGMRVVVELKKDVEPEVVLNQLYRHTQLQTSFGVNMLALQNGVPVLMNLLTAISAFVKFREEIVTRRTRCMLSRARDKAHILVGLLIALESIDRVIATIRRAQDAVAARTALLAMRWPASTVREFIALIDSPLNRYEEEDGQCVFSEEQVKAILDMKLQRLTGLEYAKVVEELKLLSSEIEDNLRILGSRDLLLDVIKRELLEIKDVFGTPRSTCIVDAVANIEDEDLIQEEDVVITVTRNGYIKRTSLDGYRIQRRGGRGRVAMNAYDDDVITKVLVSSTHDSLLFFSDMGRVYKIKVYKLPVGSMQSKGRAMVNILALCDPGEKITNIIALCNKETSERIKDTEGVVMTDDSVDIGGNEDNRVDEPNWSDSVDDEVEDESIPHRECCEYCADHNVHDGSSTVGDEPSILFVTMKGRIRRNMLSDFYNIPTSGKLAMRLADGDRLVDVVTCTPSDHVLLATRQGKAVRFPVSNLRVFKSRTSDGVSGVVLSLLDDAVVSISILRGVEIGYHERDVLLRIDVMLRVKITRMVSEGRREQAESMVVSFIKKHSIDVAGVTIAQIVDYACNEEFIITITNLGFGKRTSAYEYRVVSRGSKGIINMNLGASGASVISSFAVKQGDEILVLSESGVVIRTAVDQVRIAGRDTMGVRLMNMRDENDKVSSVSVIQTEDDSDCGLCSTGDDSSEIIVSGDDSLSS